MQVCKNDVMMRIRSRNTDALKCPPVSFFFLCSLSPTLALTDVNRSEDYFLVCTWRDAETMLQTGTKEDAQRYDDYLREQGQIHDLQKSYGYC